MARCIDCRHATDDGFCLVYLKWTALDVEHECERFMAILRQHGVGE